MPESRAPLGASHARIAAARRLTRRQARRDAGLFLAEGTQAVREALQRPDVVVDVYATEQALARNSDLLAGLQIDLISPQAAVGLSETITPQGLVAVCRRIDISLAAALIKRPRLVAALVETNDPGNAGAILRTADAAGADAIVFAGGVDVYNGKAVRATAGSLFHLDVVIQAQPDALVAAAHEAGLTVLATTGSARCALDELAAAGGLECPTMWLFGNEAHGLPQELIEAADHSVRVPIHGRAESLNLAAAAAICLYASAGAARAGNAVEPVTVVS